MAVTELGTGNYATGLFDDVDPVRFSILFPHWLAVTEDERLAGTLVRLKDFDTREGADNRYGGRSIIPSRSGV